MQIYILNYNSTTMSVQKKSIIETFFMSRDKLMQISYICKNI